MSWGTKHEFSDQCKSLLHFVFCDVWKAKIYKITDLGRFWLEKEFFVLFSQLIKFNHDQEICENHESNASALNL